MLVVESVEATAESTDDGNESPLDLSEPLLLFNKRYIMDIYFFEMNTKYISSNVLKISVISRVRSTSEIADIFNTLDEIVLVYTEKSECSVYFFR